MSSHYTPDDQVKRNLTEVIDNTITIKPKALAVTWGRDPRYWTISEKEDESSIVLNQVSWLEVTGSFPSELLKDGEYTVKFKVSLMTNAFGWQGSPVYFFVMDPKTKSRKWRKMDLSDLKGRNSEEEEVPTNLNFEFKESQKTDFPEIKFGLYEIWKGGWKGGLEIHEVIIKKVGSPKLQRQNAFGRFRCLTPSGSRRFFARE